MAPKKLTDCPENLREAIDWLIQVRHGGDKDGKDGLVHLAKALKKFIGEAIENAQKSLNKTREELECPFKHSKDETYCQHYQKQIEKRQKEIQDAGQLQDFDTDAEVKRLKGNITYCENKYHNEHYRDPSKHKSLRDIENRQNTLGDLKTKLEAFVGKVDDKEQEDIPAKSILENLCSGLEKFLGFNSATKGYDGTGIVYSDLDRLCDGVMGFLSGVLGAVKDDEAVKTYVINVDEFVEKIKKYVGNGHKGLNEVIKLVSSLLSGWEHFFDERTKEVKLPLEKLEQKITEHQNDIHKEKSNSLDKQFKDWARRSKEYLDKVEEAEEALKNVDPILQQKLELAVASIKRNVEFLKKNCENKDVELLTNTAGVELFTLKTSADIYVANRVRAMEGVLQKKFKSDIQNKILHLNTEFTRISGALESWIEKATEVVKAGIQKANEIIDKLNGIGEQNKEKRNVMTAVTKLRNKAECLREASVKAKNAINVRVKEALKSVLILDREVRSGLYQLKGGMETQLHAYVKKNLLGDITNRLGEIIKGTGGDGKGLKEIEKEAKTYAMKFTRQGTDGFDSIVEKWICDIWGKNKNVMQKVKTWIDNNDDVRREYTSSDGRIKQALTTKIAKVIVTKLAPDINEASEMVKHLIEDHGDESDPETIIGTYVTAIQTVCDEFAKKLENKEHTHGGVPGNGLSKLAGEIFGMIEREVVRLSARANKDDLELAIQYTIQQLVPMARTTGEQIRALVVDCHLPNIKTALGVAEGLQSDLEKSTEDRGSGVDLEVISPDQPFDITEKVEGRIRGILEKVVGKDDNEGKVNRVPDAHFLQYDKYIKQDTVPNIKGTTQLSGTKDANEGSLPFAIGKIESEGLKKLTEIIGEDVSMEKKIDSHTFTTLYNEVYKEFTSFCDEIIKLANNNDDEHSGNSDYGVKQKLEELHELLGNDAKGAVRKAEEGLRSIKKRVDDLIGTDDKTNNTVRRLIKDAYAFHTQIQTDSDKTIRQLKAHIDSEFKNTVNRIKDESQRLYAKTKQTQISELKEFIQHRIIEMNKVIDQDGTAGVKGLLSVINVHANYVNNATELTDIATKTYFYLTEIAKYVKDDVAKIDKNFNQLEKFEKRIEKFASALNLYSHFSHPVSLRLSTLSSFTSALDPQALPDAGRPVLRALQKGMMGFVGELEKGYVNRYDGGETIREWVTKGEKGELTPEGKNGAKVFLTLLETLEHEFLRLRLECKTGGAHHQHQIRLYDDWKNEKIKNGLGHWFKERGFRVSDFDKQDGELINKRDFTGSNIIRLMIKSSKTPSNVNALYETENDTTGDLKKLFDYLGKYNYVRHIRFIEKPKMPSNVYQMLQWLSGLNYNRVYNDLSFDGLSALFDKPEDAEAEEGGVSFGDEDVDTLAAYPQSITASDMRETLTEICHYSYDVLVAIQGHGHAGGRYACDFNGNADSLSYPSNPAACLDMLVDILHRLYDQLYFLFIQCQRTSSTNSWRDCWYGQHVGGSDWRCNEKQCINQMGNQTADQNTNQRCGQTCEQHPKCGLKSPLQSFLEDGLPGFLPHQFKKPGCKLDCSTANHRGLPCRTPMGFADISNMASHTQRGEHIRVILGELCGDSEAPLTKICGQFRCLLQRPPQTLCDMFAFFGCYLNGWNDTANEQRRTHKKMAFDSALTEAYFGVSYVLNVDSIFYTKQHTKGDVLCLLNCDGHSRMTCGRFMQPFGFNTWNIFAADHADKYLSWFVYLTETFYDLLDRLYKECCNNCTKPGTRCHGKICPTACEVQSAYTSKEPQTALENKKHTEYCKSIASCPFTRPTLAKYGFILQSISNLSGTHGPETKRTCQDLCNSLQIVLNNKETDRHVLAEFVYKIIPQFLWDIRSIFFWTTLALWLLSLLYLLHIMVIRLDLLHIKSHLHSPSSHRIAAQSLLAAARVGRLAKISYLQP